MYHIFTKQAYYTRNYQISGAGKPTIDYSYPCKNKRYITTKDIRQDE